MSMHKKSMLFSILHVDAVKRIQEYKVAHFNFVNFLLLTR